MSIEEYPPGIKKMILEYCHYPRQYLPELEEKIYLIRIDFGETEMAHYGGYLSERKVQDMSRHSLGIRNIKKVPRLFGEDNRENKMSIIYTLFDRENLRREGLGLSKNVGVYGNIFTINY